MSENGGMTPQMERMMKQMGEAIPSSKRILELNPKHELFGKLKALFESDKKVQIKSFCAFSLWSSFDRRGLSSN